MEVFLVGFNLCLLPLVAELELTEEDMDVLPEVVEGISISVVVLEGTGIDFFDLEDLCSNTLSTSSSLLDVEGTETNVAVEDLSFE